MPPHGLGQYSTNTYKAWFTVPTIPEARRTAHEGSGQAQGRWSVSNASSSTLPCRHPEVGWLKLCHVYTAWGTFGNIPFLPKTPSLWTQDNYLEQSEVLCIFCNWYPGTEEKGRAAFPLRPLPTIPVWVSWSCRWMPEMRRERDIWKLLCPLKWIRRESSTVSNLSQAWGPSYSGCLRLEDHKVTACLTTEELEQAWWFFLLLLSLNTHTVIVALLSY